MILGGDGYPLESIENKQDNIYFNFLTERYADKFCHNFYFTNEVNSCINSFMLTQFIPEDYDFEIVTPKAYLFDSASKLNKTKMYLVKGDKVKLLQYDNEFYEVKYITSHNKTIYKWLHCSAIDACE